MDKKRIAIIRLHGKTGLKKGVKDTLNMLRLYKKHTCVIVQNTKDYVGMLTKVRNYATWGEINESSLYELLNKRGKLARNKKLTEDYVKEKLKLSLQDFSKKVINFEKELKELPGLKLFFKLSPPRGGFEREGIKQQFALGGALGYRKEKISDLIKRMV